MQREVLRREALATQSTVSIPLTGPGLALSPSHRAAMASAPTWNPRQHERSSPPERRQALAVRYALEGDQIFALPETREMLDEMEAAEPEIM